MLKCPVYRNERCLLKFIFTQDFNSKVFQLPVENFNNDCQGEISSCSFQHKEIAEQSAPKEEVVETPVEPVEEIKFATRVSIHKCDNPYNSNKDNDPERNEEVELSRTLACKFPELTEHT